MTIILNFVYPLNHGLVLLSSFSAFQNLDRILSIRLLGLLKFTFRAQ